MGKQSRHLAVLGLVLVGLNLTVGQVRFDHCNDIENCMRYFESPCDTDGKRQVCLDWVRFTSCSAVGTLGGGSDGRVRMCINSEFGLKIINEADQLCKRVRGGEDNFFGIRAHSSTTGTQNTGDGSRLRISGYNNGLALCNGLDSVCSPTGNREFKVTFTVTPCPMTTTTTPVPPTTTPSPPPTTEKPACSCSTWSHWSTCSVSCVRDGNYGHQTRSKNCNSICSSSHVTETRTCSPIPIFCPRDGNWGAWSSPTPCPVTCGGSNQFRTRECNNPTPLNGGRNCVGSSFEILPCGTAPCDDPTETFRECRRRVRPNCRRPRRRCIQRLCGHLRG